MVKYTNTQHTDTQAKLSAYALTRKSLPAAAKDPTKLSLERIARETQLPINAVRVEKTHLQRLVKDFGLDNPVSESRERAVAKIRAAYADKPVPTAEKVSADLGIATIVIQGRECMAVIDELGRKNGRLRIPFNLEDAMKSLGAYETRLLTEQRTVPWLAGRDRPNMGAIARETAIPTERLKGAALADRLAALIKKVGHESAPTVAEEAVRLVAHVDAAIARNAVPPRRNGVVSFVTISREIQIAAHRLEFMKPMRAEIERWIKAFQIRD